MRAAGPPPSRDRSARPGAELRDHPDHAWLTALFRAFDRWDIEAHSRFLDPRIRFRGGNGSEIRGRAAFAEGLRWLQANVAGVRHRLVAIWREGDALTVEADATYTRLDGTEVTIPVITLLRLSAPGLIVEYRVFVDLGPLFHVGEQGAEGAWPAARVGAVFPVPG